ncbi:MAG: YceD family protein [Xanthomonadales bacterium]|nr:YceD family protein [Xanthomonadales bacterium]
MSRDFPDWIDPEKAAAAGREFSGTVPLARLPRLEGMIADPGDAEIGFRVVFGLDEQRQVRVEVSVSGRVPLHCQRTLKVFEHPIDSRSTVGIVPDDREAESLPEDYEPLLCPDNKVELVRLIGEEVLLGLPLVAIDPASSRVGDPAPATDTHRPFADLADELRKNRDKD